jgi:hypothetical protein
MDAATRATEVGSAIKALDYETSRRRKTSTWLGKAGTQPARFAGCEAARPLVPFRI